MDKLCEEMKETLGQSFESFGELAGITLDLYFESADCLESKNEIYQEFVEDLMSGKITDPQEIKDWIELGEDASEHCAEFEAQLESNIEALEGVLESGIELLGSFSLCIHDDINMQD